MHSWCALATALLLASEGVVAFPGTLQFSSGNIKRIMENRHELQQAQGGRLWARRRTNPSARLHPAETGVPDVAAPCDRSLEADSNEVDSPGSSPQTGKNKLTERGGLLLLATVPLVWGTYSPSVKYLYQMGESPPGLLFNFACYVVSVLTFAAVAGVNGARTRRTAAAAAAGAGNEAEVEEEVPPKEKALLDRYATRAGAELGLWLFLGGTVQVWGLELTTASRAGFLVQLTTVIVPVLEAFFGRRKLKPQVWFACALATVGVAMVSLGGILPPGVDIAKYIAGSLSAARLAPSGGWESIIASGNLRGDLLVACSALFYSLHVVRLGVHVSKVDTLSLARAKALSELGFSGLSVLIAGFLGGQGGNFARFISALASKPELWLVFGAVTVWNGALTSAYAMWAQTRGQASVAPSEANLVYSLQPLWSVFFAALLLKESFRGVEAAGAALLLLSLVLVAAQTGGGDSVSAKEGGEAITNTTTETGDRNDKSSGKVA